MRLELEPLGVTVYTSMAGNISSNIADNTAKVKLPSDSYYASLQPQFDSPPSYADADMPTAKFAGEVADEVLTGRGGPVFKGGNAGIAKWLVPIMPQFLFVSSGIEGWLDEEVYYADTSDRIRSYLVTAGALTRCLDSDLCRQLVPAPWSPVFTNTIIHIFNIPKEDRVNPKSLFTLSSIRCV
jgi:hypothetical protein